MISAMERLEANDEAERAYYIAESRAKGREQGIVEGRVEGRVEGKAEGIIEGKAEGIKEEKIKRAISLLDVLDIEIIVEKFELTPEEAENLKKH